MRKLAHRGAERPVGVRGRSPWTPDAWRLVALVAMTVILLCVSGWLAATGRLTTESIRGLTEAGGAWSPLLFLVLATVLPVAFVPRMIITAAGAALFGFTMGVVLGTLGGFGGTLAGYWIGLKLGYPFVEKHRGRKVRKILKFLERHGFMAVVLLRASPVTACEAVSLASGISGLKLRLYAPASLIGILPGSILYASIGAALVAEESSELSFWSAILFAALTAITVAWFLLVVWKDRRDDRRAAEDEDEVPNGFAEQTD